MTLDSKIKKLSKKSLSPISQAKVLFKCKNCEEFGFLPKRCGRCKRNCQQCCEAGCNATEKPIDNS